MTRLTSKTVDATEQATRWAAKTALGPLSALDAIHFATWRAQSANDAAYMEVSGLCVRMDRLSGAPELLAMRAEARASAWRTPGPSARLIAASVCAVTVVGAAMLASLATARHGPLPRGGVERYATAVGRRAVVRLQDGSIVELNTASAIEVAYTPSHRDIRLLQGQALFRVAKNKHRPFIVTAQGRTVTALGTVFDVRIDPRRVSVVLLEGKVAVARTQLQGLSRLGVRSDRRMLAPGEELVSGDAGDTVSSADVAQATSWRTGRVIFRDEALADAVAEFNRYNPREIVVADPRARALKVSGVFDVSQPEAFVAAATALYPLEASPSNKGMLRLQWRGAGQVVAPADNPSSNDEERRKPSILNP